jgi:putative chitinase
MPYIKALVKTVLKTHPMDSKSTALPADFALYNTGPEAKPLAAVKVIRDIGQHARIEFNPHLTIAGKQYKHLYIFAPHWEGVTALINAQVAQASPLSPAGSSIVERPNKHFAQVNNKDWADDGTASNLRYGGVQCGLTSCAIVCSEPGFLTDPQLKEIMSASPTGKFDDGVAAIFKKIGAQSISMEGHAAFFKYFGIESDCTRSATVADLKAHIEKYGAAVLGTLYKASGHFVGATGFDIKQNLVKILDPYGIRSKQSTNQWEVQFATEADVKPDWWGPDVMADLWAVTQDGWCVLPKPKGKAVVLPAATTAVGAASTSATITILQQTLLKKTTAASGTLSDVDKRVLSPGPFTCEVVGAKENHGQVKLPDGSLWFIFNAHFKGQEHVTPSVAAPSMAVPRAKIKQAIAAMASSAIPGAEIEQIVDSIMTECPKFKVDTPLRLAHFIGQTAHESGNYAYLAEIGDVGYFTDNYEGRNDLGNSQAGDGAKYPGRGWIMVTGRNNVTKFAKKIGRLDLIDDPSPIEQYPLAVTASLSWWDDNRMNPDCDKGIGEANIEAVTRVINGGINHLDIRIANTLKVATILGC